MYIYLYDPESGCWIEVIESHTNGDWDYQFYARQLPDPNTETISSFTVRRDSSQTLDAIKDIWLGHIESPINAYTQ